MSIWNTLFGWLGSTADTDMSPCDTGPSHFDTHTCDINPATGLPMLDDCGGIDVGGSPYGMDIHQDDTWSSITDSTLTDSWMDTSSIGGDSFTSWDD